MAEIIYRFNTSYVSVQVSKPLGELQKSVRFQYILCVGSSQRDKELKGFVIEFQYILCVGSRLASVNSVLYDASFNTSYVSVQDK